MEGLIQTVILGKTVSQSHNYVCYQGRHAMFGYMNLISNIMKNHMLEEIDN